MFEPGGESVRGQNLHEPLLSPCMFEPGGKSVRSTPLHFKVFVALCQNLFDHVTLDVGQSIVAPLCSIDKSFVIHPKQVQHGRV